MTLQPAESPGQSWELQLWFFLWNNDFVNPENDESGFSPKSLISGFGRDCQHLFAAPPYCYLSTSWLFNIFNKKIITCIKVFLLLQIYHHSCQNDVYKNDLFSNLLSQLFDLIKLLASFPRQLQPPTSISLLRNLHHGELLHLWKLKLTHHFIITAFLAFSVLQCYWAMNLKCHFWYS